ncbi:hypothetical protein OSB04_009423 [Centaurea solstitialis]|uniref:Senescence regulator n=1 Tax=Centaurea solstitialis TaxID=347529 RepID=A0AA38WM45_9ASTR|nr:hypothetical protein OSB04_009423 [Centaurea solstitialis]
MATKNFRYNHHDYRHPSKFLYLEVDASDQRINYDDDDDVNNFEMIKFDIWNTNEEDDDHVTNPEKIISSNTMATSRKLPLKPHHRHQRTIPSFTSPMNVPDWSKTLRVPYKREEGDHDEEWLPPHEYLARIRSASLSVHEGVGRTLKGRDLSRLRNFIWKQTGFEQD